MSIIIGANAPSSSTRRKIATMRSRISSNRLCCSGLTTCRRWPCHGLRHHRIDLRIDVVQELLRLCDGDQLADDGLVGGLVLGERGSRGGSQAASSAASSRVSVRIAGPSNHQVRGGGLYRRPARPHSTVTTSTGPSRRSTSIATSSPVRCSDRSMRESATRRPRICTRCRHSGRVGRQRRRGAPSRAPAGSGRTAAAERRRRRPRPAANQATG